MPYNEYILKGTMTTSNLSKIKPKLRTQGNVTGNFGRAKTKAGSSLRDIGVTNAKVVNITKQEDYLKRLYVAFENTNDENLKKFIYTEIKKIMIQRGEW
jgi:hypothetical protein